MSSYIFYSSADVRLDNIINYVKAKSDCTVVQNISDDNYITLDELITRDTPLDEKTLIIISNLSQKHHLEVHLLLKLLHICRHLNSVVLVDILSINMIVNHMLHTADNVIISDKHTYKSVMIIFKKLTKNCIKKSESYIYPVDYNTVKKTTNEILL